MNKTASLILGKITGVHGLNGKLKVWSFAESIDSFCSGTSIFLKPGEKSEEQLDKIDSYTILSASARKKGVLLSLEGVDNRDLAEELVGREILIDRDQLPEPAKDSWYWQDLLGLEVFDHEKGFIGRITDIFPTGANDVLVVTNQGQETLVPMHRNFVASVDIEKKILHTTLPEDY